MAAQDRGPESIAADSAVLWKQRYDDLMQQHTELQRKCNELGSYFLEVNCDECGGVNIVPWSTQGNKTDTKKRKCVSCNKFSISVPYQCIRCSIIKNKKDGGCDKSFSRSPSQACGCCEVDLQRKTGGPGAAADARVQPSPELMAMLCVEHVNDSPPGPDIQALVEKIGSRIPKDHELPLMRGPCVRCVWKASESSASSGGGGSKSLLELYIMKNQVPPPCRRMWAGTIAGEYYEICTHCWAAISHKRRSGTELRKIWSCCRIIGSRFEKVGEGSHARHEWRVPDPQQELQRLAKQRQELEAVHGPLGHRGPAFLSRPFSVNLGVAGEDDDEASDDESPRRQAPAAARIQQQQQQQQQQVYHPQQQHVDLMAPLPQLGRPQSSLTAMFLQGSPPPPPMQHAGPGNSAGFGAAKLDPVGGGPFVHQSHHHHHHEPPPPPSHHGRLYPPPQQGGISASPNMNELLLVRERSYITSLFNNPDTSDQSVGDQGRQDRLHDGNNGGVVDGGGGGPAPMSVSAMSFSFHGWSDSLDDLGPLNK